MTSEKNEPQSSQLSAMFDGELPAAECELLARRLGRDTQLKVQWSRYALIGAALRGEPTQSANRGASPHQRPQPLQVAERVALALGNVQPNSAASDAAASAGRVPSWLKRWSQPIAGTAVAAGVAALSVFWLQARVAANAELEAQAARDAANEVVLGGLDLPAARETLTAAAAATALPAVAAPTRKPRSAVSNTEPEIYTTPAWPNSAPAAVSGQFASYVVAHSEYAAPLNRRNVLSALMASDAPPAATDAARDTQPTAP